MERSLQIKRRDEIIADIQDKDFQLNMHYYALDGDRGIFVQVAEISHRELCNTPMCIAGDASRRLVIRSGLKNAAEACEEQRWHWRLAGLICTSQFWAMGAVYLGLTWVEAYRLFNVHRWDEDLKQRYREPSLEEKKQAAIEMLRRVIPDVVSVDGVAK